MAAKVLLIRTPRVGFMVQGATNFLYIHGRHWVNHWYIVRLLIAQIITNVKQIDLWLIVVKQNVIYLNEDDLQKGICWSVFICLDDALCTTPASNPASQQWVMGPRSTKEIRVNLQRRMKLDHLQAVQEPPIGLRSHTKIHSQLMNILEPFLYLTQPRPPLGHPKIKSKCRDRKKVGDPYTTQTFNSKMPRQQERTAT